MSEIIGILIAVAIATIMVPKVLGIAGRSNETIIAAATAEQQRTLIEAATTYIKQNNAAVTNAATSTAPAVITVDMLKAPAVALLDPSFSATNPYGQTWEVQVLEPTAGSLRALVLSKGGTALPDRLAARVASLVGAAGGIIPQNDTGIYAGGAATAVGTYSGWSVPLSNYSGTSGGHLAALLSFNNDQLSNSYLYRDAIPGQPKLNTMNTTLTFGSGAVVPSGSACTSAELGSMARDAAGKVLMCDGSTYKTQGSAYWQDPVSTYSNLVSIYPCNAASAWQVRTVQTPTTGAGPRQYICNGANSTWSAVSVNDSGNMSVDGTVQAGKVQVNDVVVEGASCSPNGLIAQGAAGLIVSCRSGVWIKINSGPSTRVASAANTAWRWPSAAASCSADEAVVGGGGTCTNSWAGQGFNFIYSSVPHGNGWAVSCDTPESQYVTATAYAICAK